jgi:hypothetical protein
VKMTVTETVLQAMSRAHKEYEGCEWRSRFAAMIQAALADVPDPLSNAERAALFVHDRDKDRIEAQHRLIAELEAKLADAQVACVEWRETVTAGMNAITELQARAGAAEAKLASVREWVDANDDLEVRQEAWDAIRAIIDK